MAFLLPLAKSVILKQLSKPEVKLFVVELLEAWAKQTDNKVDDVMAVQLRKALNL
tara:strand:+ start:677 stop:841 length:165 start_codon:yes stop_codon:yes gene_type:complete